MFDTPFKCKNGIAYVNVDPC